MTPCSIDCPKCKKQFQCLAEDISNCGCNTVQINQELRLLLSKNFETCLCTDCLTELVFNQVPIVIEFVEIVDFDVTIDWVFFLL